MPQSLVPRMQRGRSGSMAMVKMFLSYCKLKQYHSISFASKEKFIVLIQRNEREVCMRFLRIFYGNLLLHESMTLNHLSNQSILKSIRLCVFAIRRVVARN